MERGQRLFILVGAGGGGGAVGQFFLAGSNSALKNFKPPRSGKIINIWAVKSVTTRGSHKFVCRFLDDNSYTDTK